MSSRRKGPEDKSLHFWLHLEALGPHENLDYISTKIRRAMDLYSLA